MKHPTLGEIKLNVDSENNKSLETGGLIKERNGRIADLIEKKCVLDEKDKEYLKKIRNSNELVKVTLKT